MTLNPFDYSLKKKMRQAIDEVANRVPFMSIEKTDRISHYLFTFFGTAFGTAILLRCICSLSTLWIIVGIVLFYLIAMLPDHVWKSMMINKYGGKLYKFTARSALLELFGCLIGLLMGFCLCGITI